MTKQYTFRFSNERDKYEIGELLRICFGEFPIYNGALYNLDKRYMVAEYEGKIVAVTGILPVERSSYTGYEVTWTCTLPEHRKNGLIVHMLGAWEKKLPDDGIPIYCECWHLDDNTYPNLASVMKHLGMTELVRVDWQWMAPHRKECQTCIYYKAGCRCHNDLYWKERR